MKDKHQPLGTYTSRELSYSLESLGLCLPFCFVTRLVFPFPSALTPSLGFCPRRGKIPSKAHLSPFLYSTPDDTSYWWYYYLLEVWSPFQALSTRESWDYRIRLNAYLEDVSHSSIHPLPPLVTQPLNRATPCPSIICVIMINNMCNYY